MNRRNFVSLKTISPVKLTLADDFKVTAYEEGTVQIELISETQREMETLVLSKVLFIPDASMNLISCGQLDSKGISTVIENGIGKLLDRERSKDQIGFGTRRGSDSLYILEGRVSTSRGKLLYIQTKKLDSHSKGLQLWHQRLGNISKGRVKAMENDRVVGMNLTAKPEISDCVPCVESKQTRSRSDGSLAKGNTHHVIHFDVIGLITLTLSRSVKLYILLCN